jgi:hypothetical protein
MPLPTHPDAVLLPIGKIGGNAKDKHVRIKKIFGPVLDCHRVWTRKCPSGEFIYPHVRTDGTVLSPDLGPRYPIGHPRQRQEAFIWHAATQNKKTGDWTPDEKPLSSSSDALDKVRFGYAKPDVAVSDDDDTLVDPDEIKAAPAAAPAATPTQPKPFKPASNASTEN